MAIPFPSYSSVDALINATSFPQHKYITDSQNVGEIIEKLFGRLSVLLFHTEKQINKVLIQGRFLPKKINQWAMEARALKCQFSDLLKKQQNMKGDSVISEELVEMGIKIFNLLKKCPCKDKMMYDKPVPVIIQRRESGSVKSSRNIEYCEYLTGEKSYSHIKGKKMERAQRKSEQISDAVLSHVLLDQKAEIMLTSIGTGSARVELQKKNDIAFPVETSESEPMATSVGIRGDEIRREAASYVPKATAESYSGSLSEDWRERSSAADIEEESANLEDSKTKLSRNMLTTSHVSAATADSNPQSISEDPSEQQSEAEIREETSILSTSYSESVQIVESTSYGEIQMVRGTTTLIGTQPKRSEHHQELTHKASKFVLEEKHYLVSVKEDDITLELDHQTVLIENCQLTKPESSPVTSVLNLVEKNLRELAEEPNYGDVIVLFLQRNYHLTLIHSSFFDNMPSLRFLDLSDTRIRILPSSLFNLSQLEVLMLRNCDGLENVPSGIGKLNEIKVLDLTGTELYYIPDDIGQLAHLRHMHLSFYGPDDESEFDHLPSQLVSPSILSELKELQALSIIVHPDDQRWRKIASSILNHVCMLEKLSHFQFYFPEVEMFESFIQMSPSWNNNVLHKFHFILGHNVKRVVSRVPDEVESLFDQQEKCLKFVNGDKVNQLINTALIQVTAFYLDHHTEIKSLSEFGISNFMALKFCVVRESPKLQAIVDGKTSEEAFPCLEYLGVYYLWELKHIWEPPAPLGRLKRILKTPVPAGNFRALKCLVVNTCPKLQYILWESMLHYLSNLEEVVVEDCEKVEKIIKEEKKKVYYSDVFLPRLRKLVLHYLPDLVSLGNGLYLSEENVDVYGCPKLILKAKPQP